MHSASPTSGRSVATQSQCGDGATNTFSVGLKFGASKLVSLGRALRGVHYPSATGDGRL